MANIFNFGISSLAGASPEPQEITFTVTRITTTESTTYTALKGMTWSEWIDSDYNIDGYYISSGNYVVTARNLTVMTDYPGGTNLNGTEEIIENWQYYHNLCCFVAGTQVLTSLGGDTKSIEEVEAGELVVSYNVDTGENYLAEVNRVIVNNYTVNMADVTFEDGTIITMNEYHPIYTKGGFHSITNYMGYDTLVVGDMAKSVDGWLSIVDITRYTTDPIVTYNLDVRNIGEDPDDNTNDTYYANGIVVHNPTCN